MDVSLLTDLAVDIPHWQIGVVALTGLFAAGLTWFTGRKYVLHKRARAREFGLPQLPPRPEADPFDMGSPSERRGALRRTGREVKVFISDETATSEPYPGWVVDRSVGGLCLAVPHAVAAKSVISVRAGNAPENSPWVQVEVVHCEQENNCWVLGTRFLRTPPWGVMLLFG